MSSCPHTQSVSRERRCLSFSSVAVVSTRMKSNLKDSRFQLAAHPSLRGRQDRNLKQVMPHPQWRPETDECAHAHFRAHFRARLVFSPYTIQNRCLPTSTEQLSQSSTNMPTAQPEVDNFSLRLASQVTLKLKLTQWHRRNRNHAVPRATQCWWVAFPLPFNI